MEVNFSEFCPYLEKHAPRLPVRLFFELYPGVIASETHCPNGGLPGIEKRSDSGFLIPIYPDRLIVSCEGCSKLKSGFEEELKNY